MATSAGTIKRITTLANKIPIARLTAIGIRNCALILRSNNMGASPSDVVAVVKNIARKRL